MTRSPASIHATEPLFYHCYVSKYDKLWHYIQNENEVSIDLSFDTIKDVLGFEIDHSFLNFKKELEIYGYRVKKISLKDRSITFERVVSES